MDIFLLLRGQGMQERQNFLICAGKKEVTGVGMVLFILQPRTLGLRESSGQSRVIEAEVTEEGFDAGQAAPKPERPLPPPSGESRAGDPWGAGSAPT